jgi:protein AroM
MRLGFVTIGQSPRVDILPQFLPLLPGIEPVEAGALDDLTPDEIAALAPAPGADVLVSRLRDGREVKLDHERLQPHLEQAVAKLYREGATAVVLLCTADFPPLTTPGIFLPARAVVRNTIDAILPTGRLGVAIPVAAQTDGCYERFARSGRDVRVVVASPYSDESGEETRTAARELAAWQPDLVVMDCLGYSDRIRNLLARDVKCPIIRPASLIARWVQELSAADAARLASGGDGPMTARG